MVQKKKIKRVDIGSIEAQKARGATFAGQPEPTSPVFKAGRGGLTVAQATQARRTAGQIPPEAFGSPQGLPELALPRDLKQPQAPQTKRGIFERIKREFTGARFKEDVAAIAAGTKEPGETPSNLDIAAATVGATGLVRAVAKPATFSTQAGRLLTAKEATRVKSIRRLAIMAGMSIKRMGSIIQNRAVNKEIDILLNTSPNAFAKAIGKIGIKGVGALLGANILLTWYALDNIIGGQNFFLKEVRNGLNDGSITPDAAREALLESITAVETAESFAIKSAELNPAFYPARKTLATGIKANVAQTELTMQQIEQLLNQSQIAEQQAQQQGTDFSGRPLSSEEFETAKAQKQFGVELERTR